MMSICKKHLWILSLFAIIANLGKAQSPQKFSYQAVVRDASGSLLVNKSVGLRMAILHKSPNGTEVFAETHKPQSNSNGLITAEVGGGAAIVGVFNGINWADGPYYIKTEIDPTGGSSYTISGTVELLSVPYALYAKTAAEFMENDPEFKKSVSAGITVQDTARWNAKLSGFTEKDPLFAQSVANGIVAADTARWNAKLSTYTESDPLFSGSVAKHIGSADTQRWGNKQNKLVAGAGIKINKDTISSALSGSTSHYIGEKFGGGVIFYLWKDSAGKEHGLIVSPTDLTNSDWSNITTSVGPGAQSYWDGLGNSNAIVAQSGHVSSAAKQCLDLTLNGYSDWYLPAVSEFYMLANNYIAVARTLAAMPGATQISTAKYWTSTEFAAQNVYSFYILFYENKITHYYKNGYAYAVRPIRAF